MCPYWETVEQTETADPEERKRHFETCRDCSRQAAWSVRLERDLGGVQPWRGLSDCPSEEILARYQENTLSPTERESVERHVPSCTICRADLAQTRETLDRKIAAPSMLRRPLRVAVLAAAVLLAAGLAWRSVWLEPSGNPLSETIPLSSQRRYAENRPLELSWGNGARLRLSPGADLQVIETPDGAPPRVRLERGRMQVEVPDRGIGIRIDVPGGRVRDIGTSFTVTVQELLPPWDPQSSPLAFTSVQTDRGAVELSGNGVRVVSAPGKNGHIPRGFPPFLQEPVPIGPEELRRRLEGIDAALKRGDRKTALQTWIILQKTDPSVRLRMREEGKTKRLPEPVLTLIERSEFIRKE